MALHVHNTTASLDSFYYVQTDLCGSRAQSQACLSYAEMEQSVSSKMLGSWERVVSGLTVVQVRGGEISVNHRSEAQGASRIKLRATGH